MLDGCFKETQKLIFKVGDAIYAASQRGRYGEPIDAQWPHRSYRFWVGPDADRHWAEHTVVLVLRCSAWLSFKKVDCLKSKRAGFFWLAFAK